MDFNKIVAGLFAAGVVFVGTLVVSEIIFKPDTLEKAAYEIDTSAFAQSSGAGEAESKPKFLMGEEFAALVAKSAISDGEKLFKKCVACHTNTPDGGNKVGPHLWGSFNRDIASLSDFKYSDALASVEGKWDVDHLNRWLYNPREYAKGNRMGFIGIKDDAQRAAMIAYLKSLQ